MEYACIYSNLQHNKKPETWKGYLGIEISHVKFMKNWISYTKLLKLLKLCSSERVN